MTDDAITAVDELASVPTTVDPGAPAAYRAKRRRWQTFSSLKHRDFRLLWLGLTGSVFGYWLQVLAQGWLVLELTNSPFFVGLVTAATTLPILLFSLPGGVLADRVDKRRLLIVTRSIQVVNSFVLAAIVALGWVNEWYVLILALLFGFAWTADLPARQALVPQLVPKDDIMNAVALNNTVFNGTRIVGPALAGALVALSGPALCFFITSLGNVGMVVALVLMKVPPVSPRSKLVTPFRDLINGVGYIRRNSDVLSLLSLGAVAGLFGWGYMALMPVFARDVLRGGAAELGWLMAASGVGALVVSFAMAAAGNFASKGLLSIGGALVMALALLVFALSTSMPISLVAMVLVGASGAGFMALVNTLLLIIVPHELQGRVMSVFTLTFGLNSLGSVWSGAVADIWGASLAVAIGAGITLVFTLGIVLVRPRLRRL